MQLYQYPNLYLALRSPERREYETARRIIARHLVGPLRKVMDPACGPATWLLPFARDGFFVAGNDLAPEMVARARRTLTGYPHEIVQGDMSNLHFTTGPFDVALDPSCPGGALPDDDAMLAHVRSVLAQLRPGGLFLRHLCFDDPEDDLRGPRTLDGVGWMPVPGGGMAEITYEIVRFDPVRRAHWLRRTVRTRDVPGCPARLEDFYELRQQSADRLRALLTRAPEAEVAAVYEYDEDHREQEVALDVPRGEATLVLRRRG